MRRLFALFSLVLACSGGEAVSDVDAQGVDGALAKPDAAGEDAASTPDVLTIAEGGVDVMPPAPGFCTPSNLPGGYAVVSDRPFLQLDDSGWTHRNDAVYTIASDPTAPCSAPSVGQALFKQGFAGGSGPILANYDIPSPKRRLFVAAWLSLSPNWDGHASGVNKVFHLWNGSGASHGNHAYFSAQGSGAGKLYAQLRFQGMLPNANNQVSFNCSSAGKPAAEIVRGAWTRVEMELVSNTPGAYDGEARLWVNGTKVCEELTLGYVPSTSNDLWDLVSWNPTWGGTGGTVPADQTMRMDRVVVATAP